MRGSEWQRNTLVGLVESNRCREGGTTWSSYHLLQCLGKRKLGGLHLALVGQCHAKEVVHVVFFLFRGGNHLQRARSRARLGKRSLPRHAPLLLRTSFPLACAALTSLILAAEMILPGVAAELGTTASANSRYLQCKTRAFGRLIGHKQGSRTTYC